MKFRTQMYRLGVKWMLLFPYVMGDIKRLMKWVRFSLQDEYAIFCKAPTTGYHVSNGLNAHLNIVMLLFIVYTGESC